MAADGPCEREHTDAQLTEAVREIHTELRGHLDVRRVRAELVVGVVRVAANGLAADADRWPALSSL